MHATDCSFFYKSQSVIVPNNWIQLFTVKVLTLHLLVAFCQLLHVFHVFRASIVMFTTYYAQHRHGSGPRGVPSLPWAQVTAMVYTVRNQKKYKD